MERRILALWLPYWPAERWCRAMSVRDSIPFALYLPQAGSFYLSAVNRAAVEVGLYPGLALADARAIWPELCTAGGDPHADKAALAALAEWCGRYSPWVATDGAAGLCLDISGLAHLFGGETALAEILMRRFAEFGFTVRIAIADTPSAASGLVRFGAGNAIVVPAGETTAALAALPVAALRVPEVLAGELASLGLRKVGDLMRLARGPLATRFGPAILRRLDQALGLAPEPISPRFPPAPFRIRATFAEPILRSEQIAAALPSLAERLAGLLAAEDRGGRKFRLTAYRSDGTLGGLAIGTSRPLRDAKRLGRLFAERLDEIDPGFGIEVLILEAVADPLKPEQVLLSPRPEAAGEDLAALVDRLQNRLGRARVSQILVRDSHVPERAFSLRPALEESPYQETILPVRALRPVSLLRWPAPIRVTLSAAGGLESFRWRRVEHPLVRSIGPERIAPEWWRENAGESRDYYRVEDRAGRRFWIYREAPHLPTPAPAWYLHGLFA